MDERTKPDAPLAATWTGRMQQILSRELTYETALRVALECVEIADRYSPGEPRSRDAPGQQPRREPLVNLISRLESDVRLTVYAIYHSPGLVDPEDARAQLMRCARVCDAPA